MPSATSLAIFATLASGQPAAEPETGRRAVALEGKVREVGAGPGGRSRAILTSATGQHELVGVTRELGAELVRLSGAVVRVEGWTQDPRLAAPTDVLVEAYEIVDVGKGVKPRIGILAALASQGEMRLLFVDQDGRAELLPKGWGRKMKGHLGAKIWIVGGSKDGELVPVRFSILRPGRSPETE